MFKSAFSSALTELLEVNAPNSRDRESEEPKRTDRILHDRAVNEMLIYCHRYYCLNVIGFFPYAFLTPHPPETGKFHALSHTQTPYYHYSRLVLD